MGNRQSSAPSNTKFEIVDGGGSLPVKTLASKPPPSPSLTPLQPVVSEAVPPSPSFVISPTSALLGLSTPLLLGAFVGYRQAISEYAEEAGAADSKKYRGSSPSSLHRPPLAAPSVNPAALAVRALALGTAACIGGTGVFIGTFAWLAGISDAKEAVILFRRTGAKWRSYAESALGVDAYGRNGDILKEDQRATQGMGEEEEYGYWMKRLGIDEGATESGVDVKGPGGAVGTE